MNSIKTFAIALLAVFLALPLAAQTATPSTTLCAAITSTTTTSICLASTTGIVNQTGIYVDQEYMTVNMSANQTLAASNAYVPVTRNNRAAGSGPTQHANAAIAWIAYTPSQSAVPGLNGFLLGTQFGDIGPCTRGAGYYPHIWPNRGVKRDCVNSVWVDFAPNSGLDNPSPTATSVLTTNGALTVGSGDYFITKAGVLAMTLVAPTSGVQDGVTITLTSTTANAHTVTATALLQNGASGAPYTTATFGAYIGASITLRAKGGFWYVVTSSNVSLS